jgi:hypothetical protein
MTWYKAALIAATQSAWIEARARLAGTQPLSASVVQSEALLEGSRIRKSLLNKSVYNNKIERIGALPIGGMDFCDRQSVSDAEILERADRPAGCRRTDLRTIALEQRIDGCKRVRGGQVARGNGPCS